MASTYSNRLKRERIGDGEQAGSWGDTTNDNFGASTSGGASAIEHAIAGVLTIAVSGDITLTTGDGPTTQALNQARQACLIFTGSTVATVTVPNTEKIYHIYNNSSAIITLRITGTTTDFVMAAGTSYLIACTGSAWHALNDDKVHFAAAGTVSNTSGDITVDCAGDIVLDAGGADIRLSASGTQFGILNGTSSNFNISSTVSDKDIIFQGNDGGSTITALTLDMSDAGKATFNAGATFGAAITSNSGVVVDEITIDGDTLTATDDFIIDAAADIILDVAAQDVIFKTNGTQFGAINNNNTNVAIVSGTTTAATFNGANVTFAGTIASGAITSTGDITAFSDMRIKHDIETIEGALAKVSDMRGVYFKKNNGEAGTGVIAQEIENNLPEVVKDGEYKSVAYGNMVGILIEAIKELKAEVEKLKESK